MNRCHRDVENIVGTAVPFFLRQNVLEHVISALTAEVDRVRAMPAKRAVDKLASKLLPKPLPTTVTSFIPLNPVPRKPVTLSPEAVLEKLMREPESVTPPRAHSRTPSETGSDSKQRGKSVSKTPVKAASTAVPADMLSFYKSPAVTSKAVTHSLVNMVASAAAATKIKSTAVARSQSKFASLLEPVSLPALPERPHKVTLDDVTAKGKK